MDVEQMELFHTVALHPDLKGTDPILSSAIKVSGDMTCSRVLDPGDQVTVTVADADGTVIAQAVCDVAHPAFRAIKLQGDVIGEERVHKATVG